MTTAYYNGTFSDFSDVKLPLTDRSIFFGDGIYDAAIGKNGNIYLEKEHIDRFFANSFLTDIPVGMSKAELSSLLHELIQKSGLKQYFIYFQLSRYSEARTHHYLDTEKSNLLITIRPHSFSSESTTLSLITENDIRYRMCNIKTLNLLPAVLASKKAFKASCDEAVFIRDGVVTECAHSNIFIIKDGILKTHPADELILPGITRARMLYYCKKLEIPFEETAFTLNEMLDSEAVIVTSTTKLAMEASKIDGKTVGIKEFPLAKKIISALKNDFSNET